ncbi:Hypothetical protein NTJ_02014 [Nesidiocoris tenuis]|uniref:Uncharacterized protein n=1 Tax=Nesidiocoris tenuis TaxID=355587 RepID=A0ABN7ADF5_9HEMI|nr:Hypothetical protein NTJ_02014 [Nesidiocoris tenuis]
MDNTNRTGMAANKTANTTPARCQRPRGTGIHISSHSLLFNVLSQGRRFAHGLVEDQAWATPFYQRLANHQQATLYADINKHKKRSRRT